MTRGRKLRNRTTTTLRATLAVLNAFGVLRDQRIAIEVELLHREIDAWEEILFDRARRTPSYAVAGSEEWN